ncbi:MAG: hypothetical protein KME22_06695 [Hassallia sp. WJT32-NPBG1]|jgi:hypothetical protein|nr:hypothetical protein [Hassallia sp. WJT32-NPBG1]
MTSIILHFDPAVVVPPTQSAHFFDTIKLEPGNNLISEQDLARLRLHPDYAKYKSWGAVVIIQQ